MKRAIKGLLAAIGLAPARQVNHANTHVREAEAKIHALQDRLATMRADLEHWKQRYEEKSTAVADLRHAVAQAEAKAERAAAATARAEAQTDEWKTRATALAAELQQIRLQIKEATRTSTSARDQLMAMELKLDLLEAAVNVLDTRTREAAVSRPAAAPDPVSM